MDKEKNNNLTTFIVGAIIGAALVYLFGTKSGQKVKQELVREGQRLLDKLGKGLEEAKEKLEESETVDKQDMKAQEAVDHIPEHIKEVQKKGRRFFFRRSHSES